jgi:uncharacterized membrane protein
MTLVVGPLNEFLSMTLGEACVWAAVLAWLAVVGIDELCMPRHHAHYGLSFLELIGIP